jgi:hypothetical protein
MTDRFTKKFCPLKVSRSETDTFCAADGSKPKDRPRCGAEVKAAVGYTANYLRTHPEMRLALACEYGGIWPGQIIGDTGYFKSLDEIRSTPMDFIPERRTGTDPGEVDVAVTTSAAVSVVVGKGDAIGHLSSVEIMTKIAELKKAFALRGAELEKAFARQMKKEKKAEKLQKQLDAIQKQIAALDLAAA